MNLLICIGANYKNFTPLNNFAQRFAKEQFGALDGIFFLDSTKGLENLQTLLKDSTTQCIIMADKTKNDGILKYLSQFLADLKTQILATSITKIKDSNLWLVDLEQLYLNKEVEQKEWNLNAKTKNQLYLYTLNMDATSAITLLSGIARDFSVELKIIYDNLGILLATSGDLCGFEKAVKEMFLNGIFSSFNLAESIIKLLESKNKTITTAESCTGGLIAHTLTKQSGASAVFGDANEIKEAWLSVDSNNLKHFGAVSEAVVKDMLNGALYLSGADFALATSGIAGPTGGSEEKPIGTIYIGAKSKDGVEIIERLHFSGDRNFIQEQATLYAYLLFLKIFLKS